jgi:hypothetical protein
MCHKTPFVALVSIAFVSYSILVSKCGGLPTLCSSAVSVCHLSEQTSREGEEEKVMFILELHGSDFTESYSIK